MSVVEPADTDRPGKWRGGLRWFAAELVVVVSGVLIALALGSVYQHSQDKEKELRYLRQLTVDLERTERLMTAADSVNATWDRSIAALIRSYRGGGVPVRDSVLRWVGDIQFDNPVPVTGTADALVETGDLQLIRDMEIRGAVTSYLSRTREYAVPWLLGLEDDFVSARSMFRERVDLLEVESSASGGVAAETGYELGEINPYPLDVATLLADRDAYFLLVRMLRAKRQFAESRQAFRTDAANLRQQINAATRGQDL